MTAFKNIGLSQYFRRYGVRYGLERALFLANPLHIVKSYDQKKILYYSRAYSHVYKQYSAYASVEPENLLFSEISIKNPIWVFWDSDIEDAPEIVSVAIDSIKKYYPERLVLLDMKSYAEYVRLPDFVVTAVNNKTMSLAVFADLLRLALLEHYGGTWIDSTVYLSGELPEYMEQSSLFVFQDDIHPIQNRARYCNWLIHSVPHHRVIKLARNMLFEYWRREKYPIDYLVAYMILGVAIDVVDESELGTFPYATSAYSYLLQNHLDEKYNAYVINHVETLTPIHKLTYKVQDEVKSTKDNVYDWLCHKQN